MSVKEKIAVRVARNGIIVNTLLSGCKLFAGINARSAAMISDAVHSLSDVFAEFIVIAGVKLAGNKNCSCYFHKGEKVHKIVTQDERGLA